MTPAVLPASGACYVDTCRSTWTFDVDNKLARREPMSKSAPARPFDGEPVAYRRASIVDGRLRVEFADDRLVVSGGVLGVTVCDVDLAASVPVSA